MAISAELQEAVNHIRTHAHGMRAVLVLADEIDSVAKLEQVRREVEASLPELRKQAEDLRAAAEKARKDVAKAREDAKKPLAEIAAAEKAAQASADTLVADAQQRAATIIAQAEQRAVQMEADANAELGGVRDKIAAAKKDIKAMDGTIEARKAALADIEDRADKARQFLASLKV